MSSIIERDLTKEEVEFINQYHKCPLCLTGLFRCGPEGGAGMNVRCNQCGKEFGIGFTGSAKRPIWIGDILTRDDTSIYGDVLDWGCPPPGPPKLRLIRRILNALMFWR